MERPRSESPFAALVRPRADSMPNLPDRVEQMRYAERTSRDGGGSASASTSDDDDSPTGSSPRASPPLGRIVQAACEFCRLGHLRCDGVTPTCQQCAMRNRECVYSKPKRRGPKPGQLGKARRPKGKATASVDMLSAELAAQRSQAEVWKARYFKLLQAGSAVPAPADAAAPPQVRSAALPPGAPPHSATQPAPAAAGVPADASAATDPALLRPPAPPAMLNSYMRAYRARILPLFPSVFVPDSAVHLAPTLQRSYVLYAMFAHGARAHGHEREATELFGRAREAAKELFLATDADTLHGHLLMAFYHFLCGELEPMAAFLALSLQACRDDALLPVHQQALTLKLYATPSAMERDLVFTRLFAQPLAPRETAFALLAAVYADLRFGRTVDDATLLARLQEAERCVPSFEPGSSVLQVAVQCMLLGLRTALFMRAQRPDLAIEQAARNTELSRHSTFRDESSPYCVLGLDLSAPTNVLMNPPLGQEDVHTLLLYRAIFPLSALSVERLHPVFRPVPTLFDVSGLLAHAPPEMPMPHVDQLRLSPTPAHNQQQQQQAQQMQMLSPQVVHIKSEEDVFSDAHSDSPTPDVWGTALEQADDWSSVGPSSAPAAISFMRHSPAQLTAQPLRPARPRAIPAHVFISETGAKQQHL